MNGKNTGEAPWSDDRQGLVNYKYLYIGILNVKPMCHFPFLPKKNSGISVYIGIIKYG